ncbi:MAG: sulfatase [Bacteroidota bacterium]
MKKIYLYFLSTFLAIQINSCTHKNSLERPNILLINIDDMGWKDVGFMGSEYYHTPNIDELSSKGMVFTNAYASAANCAPSRACLMTGKWTQRHGIYTVGSSARGETKDRRLIPVENTITLAKEHKIIPEVLHELGYITCHAGKWHLSESPLGYGFDLNIGGSDWGAPKTYHAPFKVNISSDSNQYLTDAIADRAIEFIDTVSQPFFLYYSPYAVHTPIHPVDSLLYKYQNKPGWNGQNNIKYATMVENLDRNIGLLIDKLKAQKLYENTFIIFTSDNGGSFIATRQRPLRSGKGSYYEGGIRVPFFFIWSSRIQANTQSDLPITNLDVFPTILNVVGLADQNEALDGNNLLPILEGKEKTMSRPLFWHFPIYLQAHKIKHNENRDSLFRTRPGSVVRYGDWKLHYYFEDKGMELYNLSDDIGERNNLIRAEHAIANEMLDYLELWWEKTNAPIPQTKNPLYEE